MSNLPSYIILMPTLRSILVCVNELKEVIVAESLDPSTLDPGIRETVLQLRARDWDTCDSGDGVSKKGIYDEEDYLPHPHVVIRLYNLDALGGHLKQLYDDCVDLTTSPNSLEIQFFYTPELTDTVGLAMVVGLSDENLKRT